MAANNHKNGMPCIRKSNQSILTIPEAPPIIHLIFPHKCGSGKNGAKPKVHDKMSGTFIFVRIFIDVSKWFFQLLQKSKWVFFNPFKTQLNVFSIGRNVIGFK
jgi:hypothetical protein